MHRRKLPQDTPHRGTPRPQSPRNPLSSGSRLWHGRHKWFEFDPIRSSRNTPALHPGADLAHNSSFPGKLAGARQLPQSRPALQRLDLRGWLAQQWRVVAETNLWRRTAGGSHSPSSRDLLARGRSLPHLFFVRHFGDLSITRRWSHLLTFGLLDLGNVALRGNFWTFESLVEEQVRHQIP